MRRIITKRQTLRSVDFSYIVAKKNVNTKD